MASFLKWRFLTYLPTYMYLLTYCTGNNCNFYVHYDVDDDSVPSAPALNDYGIDGEGGWLLLDALP